MDIQLPDGTGTALLSDLKNVKPDCVCIIVTAHADVDSAVIAMERGAFDYLRKPVKPAKLMETIELAFETIRVKEEKRQAEEALKSRNRELEGIILRLIPMRFLTDDTNSISNSRIAASVGADLCVCPFPGRTRRCAPTKGMLLL